MHDIVWIQASDSDPCPYCGKTKWCQWHEDKSLTVCRTGLAPGGVKGRDVSGSDYWIYREAGQKVMRVERELSCRLASEDDRHKVYTAFLDQLDLTRGHRYQLGERGFPEDALELYQYKSSKRIHHSQKQEIVKRVRDLCPGINLLHIPGFLLYRNEIVWHSPLGVFIPVRDIDHKIVALKIRCDDPKLPKYITFSSKKYAGPSPGTPYHAPIGTCWRNAKDLYITEGELKADLSQLLLDHPVLSIPGVSLWRTILPVIEEFKPKKVSIGFDADARSNPTVIRELDRFYRELKLIGCKVGILKWWE